MRRLHNLFHVPEGENVTEKHLFRVLISSLCSILLCISCLVGSTWAWFETTIVNEGGVITVGSVEVAVSLVKGEVAKRSTINPADEYTYELNEVGTYNIYIANSGSIPGYCEIKLTDNNDESAAFTSGTLYPADSGEDMLDSVTITITVGAEDNYNEVLPVILEITPHWGEDPNYEVADIDEELFTNEESDEETKEEDSDSKDDQSKYEGIEQVLGTGGTEDTDETQSTEENAGADETQSTEVTESTDETQSAEATEETEGTEGTQGAGEPAGEDENQSKETESAETEPAAQTDSESEPQPQTGTEPAEQETEEDA